MASRHQRSESSVIKDIRPQVALRDGWCRIAKGLPASAPMGRCEGPSEWAHLGQHRRCHTRGMEPEERHTTGGSLMLCARHHRIYDGTIGQSRMHIEALTDRGADGPLRFTHGTKVYEEQE